MADTVQYEEDLQDDLIRAYQGGRVAGVTGPVERIDTHLNHVFLAGDRAYKLKRARKFPFVDFSSLESRRKACEAEVGINRDLGSPFYIGVIGAIRRGDGFVLAETGRPAQEWLVVMHRFDSGARFDHLAERGALTFDMMRATAETIAGMHADAVISKTAGHAADYRDIIANLRRTEEKGAAALGLHASQLPYDLLESELVKVGAMIEGRRAQGKVRHVHGDLHLRNMCLYQGKPTVFDALEFDRRLATSDVLYDLAFLLMDLRRVGGMREANALMNGYWDLAEESECALRLLPFFMALRAAVRMAVAMADAKLEEAQSYRKLAFELLEHAEPRMLAIGGLSGTGKSSVAREIAGFLPGGAGARILRTDTLRKRALGIGPGQRAHAAAYASDQRMATYRVLFAHAVAAASAHASVIMDATFQDESVRASVDAMMPQSDRFWLDAPLATRLARISDRRDDASDADTRVALGQSESAAPGPPWRRIDARIPLDELFRKILDSLA